MNPREAIILAGGKAERLGEAAKGKPKPLVPIAGRPLVAYQIACLRNAGVERVLLSCAAGRGEQFMRELGGLGVEMVRSRGAGAARARRGHPLQRRPAGG